MTTEPKTMTFADTVRSINAAMRQVCVHDLEKTDALIAVIKAVARKDVAAAQAGVAQYGEAVAAGGSHLLGAMQMFEQLAKHSTGKQQAATPAAPPRPTRIMSHEQEKFVDDAGARITNAICREVARHGKHADQDRARFAAWLDEYLSDDGQLAKYAVKAFSPIVGADAAPSVACQFLDCARTHFGRAGDPVERLQEWQDIGIDYAWSAAHRHFFDVGLKQIESRQLAACN